jgi:hypothetical protein
MTTTPIVTRRPLLQIDLVNQRVIMANGNVPDTQTDDEGTFQAVDFSDELKTKFLETIGNFWNSEDDKLEFFAYYTDKTFIVQRKRKKYDFKSDSNYFSQYQFKGATQEQGDYVFTAAKGIFSIRLEGKRRIALESISAVEKEVSYFEAKYLKRKREKRMMLSATDWRVLPDVTDKYEGEKDQWIAWRHLIRQVTVPNPTKFDTMLDFAKSIYNIKYPIDPAIYREKYPDGKLADGETDAPAYLDETDENQWVGYDTYASKDFVNERVLNALIYAKVRTKSPIYVEKKVRDIIKAMDIESIDPDFDSELFKIAEE